MNPTNPELQDQSSPPTQSNLSTIAYDNKHILFILLVLFIGGMFGFLFARQQPLQEKQSLTIVGNATIETQADKAIIEAATEATSPEYIKAVEDNKKKVEDVKKALKAAGVPDTRFKVINSYTDQDYDYTDADVPNPPSNLPQSYYAVTSFEITLENNEVTNIDKYIKILTDLRTDPYVSYTLKNPKQYKSKLQQEAVLDARKQAENLAKTNKLSIKKVLSIQDRTLQQNSTDEFYGESNLNSDSRTIKLDASYEVKYELGNSLFSL